MEGPTTWKRSYSDTPLAISWIWAWSKRKRKRYIFA